MAGLFGVSVNSSVGSNYFRDILYWGTFYVRHLGEDHSGLASADKYKLICKSSPGFFAANFANKMKDFSGNGGIGYCGSSAEPFQAKRSRFGSFAICFNGNITNFKKLTKEFDDSGHLFERSDDVELIAKIIAQERSIINGIKLVQKKVEGAYSFLLLNKDKIYAVRCSAGQWPLIIGTHRRERATIVSSESGGFDNLDFNIVREVIPGETICFSNGDYKVMIKPDKSNHKKCSFYPCYTSNPAALVNDKPATLVRKELGACLAKRDIANGLCPHVIIPVPDSGRFHAIGYNQEFAVAMMKGEITRLPFYDEWLIKYGFIRSFLGQSDGERKSRAFHKILITAETINDFLNILARKGLNQIWQDILKNKRIIIVVCDDSVVRGTQIGENLGPKIKSISKLTTAGGIKIEVEIHVRASYPELRSRCPYGKTTRDGEVLAESTPRLEDRAKKLKVESLLYNTLDDLFNVLGQNKAGFCYECALPSK